MELELALHYNDANYILDSAPYSAGMIHSHKLGLIRYFYIFGDFYLDIFHQAGIGFQLYKPHFYFYTGLRKYDKMKPFYHLEMEPFKKLYIRLEYGPLQTKRDNSLKFYFGCKI